MSFGNPSIARAKKTKLAYFNINPPVINVYGEIFHEVGGVTLHSILVYQTNTGAAQEDIDVLITIDGRTILYNHTDPMNSDASYSVFMKADNAAATETDAMDANVFNGTRIRGMWETNGNESQLMGLPLYGHDIKVETRQVSAVGAGAQIFAWCIYEVEEAL